eukprot:SAG31_NODE_1799_length_7241_cov_11.407029_5_plen_197_part_00
MRGIVRMQKLLDHTHPLRRENPAMNGGKSVLDCAAQPWLRSHGPRSDPPGSDQIGMSAEETAFFKKNGYIIKRKLISETSLSPYVDRFWKDLVPTCIKRSDKRTWVDPARHVGWEAPGWVAAESARAGRVNRAYPAGYGEANINWQALGGEPDFVDATSAHPDVLRMVRYIQTYADPLHGAAFAFTLGNYLTPPSA